MTKIAVASLGPAWVMALRLTVAAAVLVPVALLVGHRFRFALPVWTKFTWLAIAGHALPFFLISWGTQFISSGVSGLLMGAIPLFVVVLAHFFLADEQLTASRAVGFILGFGGLVYLIGPGEILNLAAAGDDLLGELAVVGGCISYAIHAVSAKRLGFEEPVQQTASVCFLGSIIGVLFAFAFESEGLANVSAAAWWSVIGLGALPTAAASLLMYRLLMRVGPSFVAYSNYLVPVYALLFGAVVLDEALNSRIFIALAMILAGIAISRIQAVRA